MTAVQILRNEAEIAFSELASILEGTSERQAWGILPQKTDEYLNTDGSIQGVTLHIASSKFMFASIAFRNSDIRWRDAADSIEGFEPNWDSALTFLEESQKYWMESWAQLSDSDLTKEVSHFSGNLWPVWKIIRMQNYHDAYHGGQIAMLRYAVTESESPPPSYAMDIRRYCSELKDW